MAPMGFAGHPVGFYEKVSVIFDDLPCFFFQGRLFITFSTPFTVLGPVLNPPCKRQRPLLYKSRRLQGVPARVFAPHTKSWHISGIDNPCP